MLRIGQRLGNQTVEALLGEDSLASTWLVRASDGQPFVVRLLQVRLPDFQERFRRSAELLQGVRHPNLVRVRQVIEIDGLPAVVTEHVGGGDLTSWIGGVPRSAREVLPVFHGLVTGVGAAHDLGLIHRNLKPTKVLMTLAGTPKVNDFALGKVTATARGAEALTQMGTTFGTPEYMPPEQFRGAAEVDPRADVFALGCLLYEMLAGHRAFRAKGLMKIYAAVVDSDYEPLPPEVPPTLIGLVADLLAPEPEGRPQSTDEILARLREDPEVAALLPTFARQDANPTLVASSMSPELKLQMELEEQAEAEARAAEERRRVEAEERARRKGRSATPEPAPEAEPAEAEPESAEAPEPAEAPEVFDRSYPSAIPPTPAPLEPRASEARTIPPEAPVRDRARTLPPEKVFKKAPPADSGLPWKVALLVAVAVALVVVVAVLGLALATR